MISVKFGVRYRGVVDGTSNYRAFYSGELTAVREKQIKNTITSMYGVSAIITFVEFKQMNEAILFIGETK
ncbi:hypothetical protein A5gp_00075 [Alteromonas phage vB_AemP_PT15-A5]|nr:hypothetical protein A5gp_00075 [Alteromonas phage vB_AemP_PT15-A5]